jgi:alkylation response protein AidB-like acyl-CoA dehydrogenase
VFACFIFSKADIAKVHAAEVVVMVTNKAMELMGSYGYVRDYNVEKYWRDLFPFENVRCQASPYSNIFIYASENI